MDGVIDSTIPNDEKIIIFTKNKSDNDRINDYYYYSQEYEDINDTDSISDNDNSSNDNDSGFSTTELTTSYFDTFSTDKGEDEKIAWWSDFESLHITLVARHYYSMNKEFMYHYDRFSTCPRPAMYNINTKNIKISSLKFVSDPLDDLYKRIEPFYRTCSDDFKSHIKGNKESSNDYSTFFLEPHEEDIPPIYRPINNAYARNVKALWSQSELIPLLKMDIKNYPKLHKYTRFKIRKSILWIIVSDGVINGQVNGKISNILPDPYSRLVIGSFVPHIEGIHQIFYSTLESVMIDSELTPQKRAEAIKSFKDELSKTEAIQKKIKWTEMHLSPVTPRVISFIAMAIQEGIGFQPQFNNILAVGEKLLPGLVLGTRLVIRDENLHQMNWTTVSNTMDIRPPASVIIEMIKEYIQIEDENIDSMEKEYEENETINHNDKGNSSSSYSKNPKSVYTNELDYKNEIAIPPDLLSLTPEIQKKSIRFQANFIVNYLLGYTEIPFPEITEQPVAFLETQGMQKSVQFFEAQNTEYLNNDYIKWKRWVENFCPDKKSLHDKINSIVSSWGEE